MAASVILPSLTDQMVLGVFKYLVEAEMRKSLNGLVETKTTDFRYGCQEGMIASLVLMFGEADNLTAEIAYDSGTSWSHMVEEIVGDLQSWTDTLEAAADHTEVDFGQLQDAIDNAVNKYALKHPKKLGDALRVNL